MGKSRFSPFEEVDAKLLKICKSVFGRGVDFLTRLHARSGQRPPKLGGQHDRDEVEIVRGEVPRRHPYNVCLGTSARATLPGRAALLTQNV